MFRDFHDSSGCFGIFRDIARRMFRDVSGYLGMVMFLTHLLASSVPIRTYISVSNARRTRDPKCVPGSVRNRTPKSKRERERERAREREREILSDSKLLSDSFISLSHLLLL